jgi:hypothetical protein
MSALISRDPFARQELHREVMATSRSCDNCGGFRWRGGRKLQSLFAYFTESDGGRRFEHRGLFCSKPCHDSYHT